MKDVFWLGLICGMMLFGVMWWLDRRSFNDYLRRRAEPAGRTPVKIGDGFYYVVPEREYVMMRVLPLARPAGKPWWKERYDLDQSTRGGPLRPGS